MFDSGVRSGADIFKVRLRPPVVYSYAHPDLLYRPSHSAQTSS
jgi:hypothetical protein